MKLAIIILNWNRSDQTRQCVHTIRAWAGLTPDIWIVDNASCPEQKQLLDQEKSRCHCIFSEANLGFAGGNNLAIRQILQSDCQFVLLLNNDAEIAEDNLLKLIASFQADQHLGIVGPLLHEQGNNPELVSAGGRNMAYHPHTRILKKHKDLWTSSTSTVLAPVEYVPGAVALVKLEVFRTAGLLDENYFFSGEMADFCVRTRQHGYRCAINTASEANHTGSGHSATSHNALYTYYQLRNRFLFSRKFYYPQLWYLFPLWTCYGLSMLLRALVKIDTSQAKAIMLALTDGWHARFGNRNDKFPA